MKLTKRRIKIDGAYKTSVFYRNISLGMLQLERTKDNNTEKSAMDDYTIRVVDLMDFQRSWKGRIL